MITFDTGALIALERRSQRMWKRFRAAKSEGFTITVPSAVVAEWWRGRSDIREDILDEKIMSAIVEIKVPVERTEDIVRMVHEVEKQVDTVVSLGVGVRCDEHGDDNLVLPILEKLGYHPERAKTNTGLGRITNKDSQAARQPETVAAR